MNFVDYFHYGIFPTYKEAQPGDQVQFTCNSLQALYSKTPIIWIFNDGPISNFAENKSWNTIVIKNAQVEHTGLYTCYGLMKTGRTRRKFLATAKLNIFGKFLLLHKN